MNPYNPNGIWTSKKKKIGETIIVSHAKKIEPAGRIHVQSPRQKPPEHRKIFWWIGGAVVLVGVIIAIVYLTRPALVPTVTVAVSLPRQAFIGDPFPVSITVTDPSEVGLTNAQLVVQLPAGLAFVGNAQDEGSTTWPLGDIASGTAVTETSTLIAIGNPQSVAPVSARVYFATSLSSKQEFLSGGTASVAVGGPAVSVSAAAPTNVIDGTAVSLTITYTNRASDPIGDVDLAMAYPPAFSFVTSSIPAADISGDSWHLGDLAPGASGTIVVWGNLSKGGTPAASASAPVTYHFPTTVSAALAGQIYTFPGSAADVSLVEQPLTLTIVADGSPSYISSANDNVAYTLTYANHSNVALQGVTISAKMTGAMFNFGELSSAGSFDSRTDTALWSPATVPALASLVPGASGQIIFHVRTLQQFPIASVGDKNYTLQVDGVVTSPTVLPGIVVTSTLATTTVLTKVGGAVTITSQAYRYEKSVPITNTGPYPPVENQTTDYTIHWTVRDTGTDLQNVIVTATLPTGVVFTSSTWSNVSTTPQYDSRTGIITWLLPSVPATAGVAATSSQAVFQIADTPAVNQVGGFVSLLGKATVQATDAFTAQTLNNFADPITSDLRSDPTAAKIHNAVVQGQ